MTKVQLHPSYTNRRPLDTWRTWKLVHPLIPRHPLLSRHPLISSNQNCWGHHSTQCRALDIGLDMVFYLSSNDGLPARCARSRANIKPRWHYFSWGSETICLFSRNISYWFQNYICLLRSSRMDQMRKVKAEPSCYSDQLLDATDVIWLMLLMSLHIFSLQFSLHFLDYLMVSVLCLWRSRPSPITPRPLEAHPQNIGVFSINKTNPFRPSNKRTRFLVGWRTLPFHWLVVTGCLFITKN